MDLITPEGIKVGGIVMGWSIWGQALAMIGIVVFLAVRDRRSQRKPVLTGQAVCLGRSTCASHVRSGLFGRDSRLYRLTFRLSDGDELTVYTSEKAYLTLETGLAGQLTWQGENMLKFESTQ